MDISVNGKNLTLQKDAHITDILKLLGLPLTGVAVAVNNDLVPRDKWQEIALKQGDKLTVIGAACGG